MGSTVRGGLVVVVVGLAAAGLALSFRGTDAGRDAVATTRSSAVEPRPTPTPTTKPGPVPAFGSGFIDDSGYELVSGYTPAIRDRSKISEVVAAYQVRPARARADLLAKLDAIDRASPRPDDLDRRRALLQVSVGLVAMYEGDFAGATPWFERATRENPGLDSDFRTNLGVLRGIASLRRGELENCVECLGPSSCIFPIRPEARHLKPNGSREAIGIFREYLGRRPDDLGVRWLLNLASMTLGEHPAGLSSAELIPTAPTATGEIGRFVNIAADVGLTDRGPNMLGGSVFDDFDGDGLPDLLVTSGDWDRDPVLYLNRGGGRFEDAGPSAGLTGQLLAVNATQADYDNDGRLDVLLLRGGWETPSRLTLLRNKGGTFEDVTVAAGLALPIATQSAAWGDFDNDGRLDLFVAGEFRERPHDPRNRCRLYRNRGDGTFEDVAARAGVENERWAKGAAWGDTDGDGFPELYVSNMNGPNRFYRNNRDGTFTDAAPELGLIWPLQSFSCWFWDFDDDGLLDLFVTGFGATLSEVIADRIGRPEGGERPRLYKNLGGGRFADVAVEAGLDHVYLPMGSNFADMDNDGHLDLYLATGRPSYSYLVPNVMLRGIDGRRFEDVTDATGTGHLQKGHGVSFADFDRDGDLDLFVQTGGQTPGDRAHNVLFRNPGNANRHVTLRLVGTKSNRSAIGARLRIEINRPDGSRRSIHRVIGGGSSFGGNSLAPTIGLGDARSIASITVVWPGGATETFPGVAPGGSYEIREGEPRPRNLPK